MKDLEFSRNISIGQYLGTGSRFHRLTPASKYLVLLALSVPALAAPTPIGAIAPFFAALLLGRIAKIPPSFLVRGLKPALPVFVFAGALQFLFGWPGDDSLVLLRLGPLSATLREAWLVVMIVVRTASMIAAVGLFTATTSEAEAARGIEDALAPFSKIGIPAHRLGLAVATSIRFVPIVAAELEAIVKAQASRGATFGSAKGGLVSRVRSYLPLFVPVTVRALERAELLAEAMEARGYTGEGRSRYVLYPRSAGEPILRVLALLVSAGLLAADILILSPRIRPF